MHFGRKTETAPQFTFETFFDRIKYEFRRGRNKENFIYVEQI